MFLSIIIPLYNVEKYVHRCLSSVLNQPITVSDYEIIIVNDGSTDNSLSIVKDVVTNAPNVTIINQENKGLSAARNAGLAVARGKYIWFIDSDDWVANDVLNNIFDTIKNNNNPDVIELSRIKFIDQTQKEQRYIVSDSAPMNGKKYLAKNSYQTSAAVFVFKQALLHKRSLLFIEGVFHEDNDFIPKLLFFAQSVAFYRPIVYYHRYNKGSITNTKGYKRISDLLLIAQKQVEFQEEFCETQSDKLIFNRVVMNTLMYLLSLLLAFDDNQMAIAYVKQIAKSSKLSAQFKISHNKKHKLVWLLLKISPRLFWKIYARFS